jgi:cytochrome c oxidase subunit 2
MKNKNLFLLAIVFVVLAHSIAVAAVPQPWGINFQPSASAVQEHIHKFHTLLLWIIIPIVVFVSGLLLYVMLRFNAKRNPVPSKTSHNTLIEIIWTAIPVLILVVIAVPSFRLLYYEGKIVDPELTVKVTGHQWYWQYTYPDNGDIDFDSNIIADADLKPEQRVNRLLEVDNQMVVPVDTNIRIISTAADVLHSWAVPSLGVKKDSVPGRLNETWFKANKEGVYYGQCSEICGVGHGFMPIAVKVVSKDAFAAWVKAKGGTMEKKPVVVPIDTPASAPVQK